MYARLIALQNKHAVLEKRLAEEHRRPCPDDLELMRLKMMKLRVKDELEALWRKRREMNRGRFAA